MGEHVMKKAIVTAALLLLPAPASAQSEPRVWTLMSDAKGRTCSVIAQRGSSAEEATVDTFSWQVRDMVEINVGFSLNREEAQQLHLPANVSQIRIDVAIVGRDGDHILHDQPFDVMASAEDGGGYMVAGMLPIDTLTLLEKGDELKLGFNNQLIYTLNLAGSATAVRGMGPCIAAIGRSLEGNSRRTR